MHEDLTRKGKELQKKMLATLTASQMERLKEIQLQQMPAALSRPEVIKALEISEEQAAKIRALGDRTGEKKSEAWPDLRGLDAKQRRQKMIEYLKESDRINAEAVKPILDVLTPQQRAKLEKLQGKKVDLTPPYDEVVPEDILP